MKDLYTPDSPALISPADFYGEKKHFCDTCLVILSHEIHDYLLSHYDCSCAAVMFGCNRNTPIYTFSHEGLPAANHDIRKLMIALHLAKRITGTRTMMAN